MVDILSEKRARNLLSELTEPKIIVTDETHHSRAKLIQKYMITFLMHYALVLQQHHGVRMVKVSLIYTHKWLKVLPLNG